MNTRSIYIHCLNQDTGVDKPPTSTEQICWQSSKNTHNDLRPLPHSKLDLRRGIRYESESLVSQLLGQVERGAPFHGVAAKFGKAALRSQWANPVGGRQTLLYSNPAIAATYYYASVCGEVPSTWPPATRSISALCKSSHHVPTPSD